MTAHHECVIEMSKADQTAENFAAKELVGNIITV